MLAARLTAQLLAGPPAESVAGVAERLLAIQGQDERGARLAVRARSAGLTAADVDRALTDERSVLITWLNRGTLHLVRSDDYPWLHALTTPQLETGIRRRIAQEGLSPGEADRGVAVMERALAGDGPLTREQLRDRIAAAGVRVEGQALVYVFALASLRGLVVRGPMVGGRHAYVLVRDWLGPQRPVERDAALAELGRRYLAGHGPATDRDLARWAGITLGAARSALGGIARELDHLGDGLVDLAGRPSAAPLPPPRLLGAFEPVLLGWTSRDDVLGEQEPPVIAGGLFRPFALVRGRAAATWALRSREVALEPFAPLDPADAAALEADAADVVRFLGAQAGRR